MTKTEVLEDALKLLRERGVSRGEYARDAEGRKSYPMSEGAHSFCAVGAICQAAKEDGVGMVERGEGGVASEAYNILAAVIVDRENFFSIPSWNDGVSDEEVLKAFEKAITLSKEEV